MLRSLQECHPIAAQISLAWVTAQGGIPVPETTKIECAASDFAAQDTFLNKEDMEKLESLGSEVKC